MKLDIPAWLDSGFSRTVDLYVPSFFSILSRGGYCFYIRSFSIFLGYKGTEIICLFSSLVFRLIEIIPEE